MPIEIRELIIKATVSSSGGNGGMGDQDNNSDNNNSSAGGELVNTCIEKILEILKEKNER